MGPLTRLFHRHPIKLDRTGDEPPRKCDIQMDSCALKHVKASKGRHMLRLKCFAPRLSHTSLLGQGRPKCQTDTLYSLGPDQALLVLCTPGPLPEM